MALKLKTSTNGIGHDSAPKCEPVGHVFDWLKLVAAGPLIEMRAIGVERAGTTAKHVERAIYKTDDEGLKRLAKDARALSPRAEGVYVVMNETRADMPEGDGKSVSAADIVRRHWLLVDIDPVRPADVGSTDEEKYFAWLTAQDIRSHLDSQGWPAPLLADSGNGYHLRYRIDLPADDGGLVGRVLKALAAKFDGVSAKVDQAVHDAPRICKLYGTLARKGPHTADRPHRAAIVLEAYSPMEVVSADELEAVAATAPAGGATTGIKAKPKAKRGGLRLRDLGDDPIVAHAIAALDEETAVLASTPPGGRHKQLYKSAAAINELVNAGSLEEDRAIAELRAAAQSSGLPEEEIDQTIRSAQQKTAGKARDLSHVGGGKPGGGRGGKTKSKINGFVLDPITGLKEPVDDERRLARLVLKERRHPDGATIRCWRDDWHVWEGGAWRIVGDKEINATITRIAKQEFEKHAIKTDSEILGVGTRLVANISNSLRSIVHISDRVYPSQPAWVGIDGPDPRECLNCRNGVLHLPTLIAEGPEKALIEPTPGFFAPNVLDYDFDPNAPQPTAWIEFLDSVWGDDKESQRSLRQWFGYLLTGDTRLQSILMIVGPPRSGKGTIGRTIVEVVGQPNVATPTLSSLGERFGSQDLIGKTVALIAEARISGRSDSRAVVERLLSISGEDVQSIERKRITNWTGRLPTRIVLLGNETPRLSDHADALMQRLVVLKMTKTFAGREDRGLEAKIKSELSGILLWAIQGWDDLRKAGGFIRPASGEHEKALIHEQLNPVSAFIAECVDIGRDHSEARHKLYDEWNKWCRDNGRDKPGTAQGFFGSLRAALLSKGVEIEESRPRAGGVRERVVSGLKLRGETGSF